MLSLKDCGTRWALCEFTVATISWIFMAVAYYGNAWLTITHFSGNVEMQRGLDEDCLYTENGSICYDWGVIVQGRFPEPLESIEEPSIFMYLALCSSRILLLLIPIYLLLPLYSKYRFGSQLGPYLSGILTIAPVGIFLILNISMIISRFRPGSLIPTIPPGFRLVLGWSYFLFVTGAFLLYSIGFCRVYHHKSFTVQDEVELEAREALPTAPPGYRS